MLQPCSGQGRMPFWRGAPTAVQIWLSLDAIILESHPYSSSHCNSSQAKQSACWPLDQRKKRNKKKLELVYETLKYTFASFIFCEIILNYMYLWKNLSVNQMIHYCPQHFTRQPFQTFFYQSYFKKAKVSSLKCLILLY